MLIGPCGVSNVLGFEKLTILLTGASGFVGDALLRRLQRDDCDVLVWLWFVLRLPAWRVVLPTVFVEEGLRRTMAV